MFWIIGADGAAKALAEMLSGMGTIPSAAGRIIGGQFQHAEWEGLHFYDLLFPLFIFVTGVAIVFSLTRLIQQGKSTAHWRVLRRSLFLFALGLVYEGVSKSWPESAVSASWPDIQLLGVLNRIALCYLFASLLFLNLRLPGLVVAFVAILLGYWALMTFVPVSGIGAGSYALYFINGIVGFQPLATQLVGGDMGSFVNSDLTPGAGSFLAHAMT